MDFSYTCKPFSAYGQITETVVTTMRVTLSYYLPDQPSCHWFSMFLLIFPHLSSFPPLPSLSWHQQFSVHLGCNRGLKHNTDTLTPPPSPRMTFALQTSVSNTLCVGLFVACRACKAIVFAFSGSAVRACASTHVTHARERIHHCDTLKNTLFYLLPQQSQHFLTTGDLNITNIAISSHFDKSMLQVIDNATWVKDTVH